MYKDDIQQLIAQSPLEIDTEIQLSGRPPTMANSEFLTNKEQGDWAEQIVYKAINEFLDDYFAVKYGRTESMAAGDEGFPEFYEEYRRELNSIGKRPDLLIFEVRDFPDRIVDIENDEDVRKAVAALEVRSSSFLVNKYNTFMEGRQSDAIAKCREARRKILSTGMGNLLRRKNDQIHNLIDNATDETFKELDFRCPSWSLTQELRKLTELLRELKENTIKVNLQVGKEILGKIDMPQHRSAMKELDRGRLLFYVTFDGGKGYLDREIFMRDIINA